MVRTEKAEAIASSWNCELTVAFTGAAEVIINILGTMLFVLVKEGGISEMTQERR